MAAELPFELIDYFKERCLEHPEVDPEIVVEVAQLNGLHLDLLSGNLRSGAADLAQLHDVMDSEITKESPYDIIFTKRLYFVALGINIARREELE